MQALRAVGVVLWAGVLATACSGPPSATPSPSASPSAARSPAPTEAPSNLEALRASDQFVEFAEHERAAKAPYARLAWENFAPIVDGRRVEWSNKAALWDSIAPRIRDEALLLGPEYREPLWDNTNAIPNGVSMVWNDEDTEGRGHFVEFLATYSGRGGPAERYWGLLIARSPTGVGSVLRRAGPFDVYEDDFPDQASAHEYVRERAWAWIFGEGGV